MTKAVKNIPASVRARLLRRSHELSEDFSLLLQRYAAERFLYRLAESSYRSRFVLKGAMLFAVWGGSLYRTTRDLDLGGFGPGDGDTLVQAMPDICAVQCPEDGLLFHGGSLQMTTIRAASEDVGFRAHLEMGLAGARIRLQIDVGYGDVMSSGAVDATFPTILDHPPPRIRAYPREGTVAEKVHAMVLLEDVNTRFKDFFDIRYLAQRFEFDRITLAESIERTFQRRGTTIPDKSPIALTAAFWKDSKRYEQLVAFGRRARVEIGTNTGEETLAVLHAFLLPVLDDLRRGDAMMGTWPPGGPWR